MQICQILANNSNHEMSREHMLCCKVLASNKDEAEGLQYVWLSSLLYSISYDVFFDKRSLTFDVHINQKNFKLLNLAANALITTFRFTVGKLYVKKFIPGPRNIGKVSCPLCLSLRC